ncbi:hypothetical protein AB0J38_14285 [Streptomyces sp. NPDC050095]|uniref:hypothetical protein n=1 Tax=unclassified Streptomyces TaxID=2593676 RepID=UPI003436A2E4
MTPHSPETASAEQTSPQARPAKEALKARWRELNERPFGGYDTAPQAPAPAPAAVPTMSVTRTKKKTSHTFHLLMTVLTAGVWGLFVWLPMTVWNASGINKKKSVTRYQ